MALAVVDAFAKFKERGFIHSGDIEGGLKFQKGSPDLEDAFFVVIFFHFWVGLGVVDPLAKFKQREILRGGSKFQKRSRDPDHAQ